MNVKKPKLERIGEVKIPPSIMELVENNIISCQEAVFLGIIFYYNKKGNRRLSSKYLGARIGVSYFTVKRICRRLQKKNILKHSKISNGKRFFEIFLPNKTRWRMISQ